MSILLLSGSAAVEGCDLDWTVQHRATAELDAAPVVEAVPTATLDDAAPAEVRFRASDADVADASTDADADADADAPSDAALDADASDGNGCGPTQPCAADAYCVYADHYCGSGLTTGQCQPRPTSCADAAIDPACGCGGTTYTSPCAAAAAGTDVSIQACTTPPPGSFSCGFRFCDANQPCLVTGSGADASYSCLDEGSCTLCLCALSCAGGTCANEGGNVTLRCP